MEREAPATAFEDLVRQARQDGASPEELSRLVRATGLSLNIRSLFSRRQQREAGLAALVDTARDLTEPYELDALLKVITRRARLLLGLDMSWVTFTDLVEGCSRVGAADGHASALTVGFAVPLDGGVGRQAAVSTAPFWTSNYLRDDRFAHNKVIDEVVRAEGLHAIMAVPLHHENAALGVLYVADRNVRHFTPDEVSLMSSLGDLAAVAIEKTRLLEQTRHEVSELERGTSRAMLSSSASSSLSRTHRTLLDLVLGGAGLPVLAAAAAEAIGATLVVQDREGRTLARHTHGTSSRVEPAGSQARLLDAHTEGTALSLDAHTWVASVSAGEEMLGGIVLIGDEPVTPFQSQLLEVTAQVTAVVLVLEDRTALTEGHLRDEFFAGLLNGTEEPSRQLVEQGRRFSVLLDEPHVLVAARPEQGVRGRAVTWASSYAHRYNGLRAVDGDVIVLLLPGTDPEQRARKVSGELGEVLGVPVTTGSAGPTADPGSVARVHQEARRCLDAMRALAGPGSSASPRRLGFLGLLLADQPDVSGFIQDTIGLVLDYDEQQCTELVPTLHAYFDSSCSPSRAAELLHVHPNTVSRRLERITELLGEEWQKPARVLQVQLALQLHQTRKVLSRGRRTPTKQTRGTPHSSRRA
ncbi:MULTISPECIES: helix-turn-helix domain-containing protein [unclassified Streptomyces]|uniref:helix-turn-helix domain-containing protein n=1 Tax=unclassified Streptomyces TaxID=2593676 RepID=UPI001F540363|nr:MULTISPECIES: helix-turn-helix domain-containing protein [unclassified Streptomyces]